MGGKGKKRSRNSSGKGGPTNKQRRHEVYWIDDCRDSTPTKGVPLMTVIVSQSNLTDNHTHGSAAQTDASATLGSISSAETKEVATIKCVDKASDEAINGDHSEVKTAEGVDSLHEVREACDYKHAFISVKRRPSAAPQKRKFQDQSFRPLPNGDCGDGVLNPYPKTEVADKYWAQRKRLFSRFDDGIQLDKEGWFSVTPEAIANHIAERIARISPDRSGGLVVLDAFCGAGGNLCALARRPEISLVICVDTDLARLKMAAKNASIYNVEASKLLFLHDNAIRILSLYSDGKQSGKKPDSEEPKDTSHHGYAFNGPLPERLDCIFLSPPWGGMDYSSVGKRHFVLTHISVEGMSTSTPVNGEELLTMSASAVKQVVYFLPRNLNGVAFGRSALQAGYVGSVELEKNVLNGKFKTVTAYLGFDDDATKSSPEEV